MIDRKGTFSLCSALVVAAVVGVATPALAQEAAPAATEPAPATTTHHRNSSTAGGAGLGVGGTAFLSGLAGPNVVYDMGQFHLEALFGFLRRPVGATNATIVNFGVGGWYHLNMGDSSDFSLGGTVGMAHDSLGDGNTTFIVEPGAMIRAFVTSNVALHSRLGFVLVFDDDDTFALDANVMGAFGLTYFFR